MKTLTDQYRLIEEGKGNKDGFLRNAKRQFPNYVPNHATYNQATNLLKKKGIISENFVGTPMVGNPLERKKEGFENAFEKFLKEAEVKAEEKKVSKEVEEDLSKNYDAYDKKNPDNMIFGQIQMGVYYEAKQEKNVDKTLEEIKSIVFKNLEKDPIYYTKNHMYGTDMGYTEDAPGLGIPKEPKGKYKSSGYGNLKEDIEMGIGGVYLLFKNNKLENIMFTDDMKPDEKLAKVLNSAGYETSFTSDSRFSQPKSINKFKGKSKEQLKLKENKEPVNEIAIAGGIVTKPTFSSQNYMDFFGLNEVEHIPSPEDEERIDRITDKMEKLKNLEEDKAPAGLDRLIDVAEEIFDDGAGMSLRSLGELLDDVKKHMASKYGE